MSKNIIKAIEAMESMMTPESIQRSRKKAEQEILAIKLGQLRERCGLQQDDSVSRLEKRKDIKISTLIDYLNGLGMGLEIRTYPKQAGMNVKEEVLLKI